MSIGAKIGAWFTVGLVVIAAIGGSAYVSTQNLIEENRWVTHTYEVKEGLEHVLSVLKDTETGQRGFLLTDKEQYLEPYNAAVGEIQHDIDALADLTRDDPAQQESLKQVRKLADAKLAKLRETIELRRKSGLEPALAVVRSDRGKKIMDELRGVVAEMEGREQQLLKERKDAAKTSADRTIWTIAVWMPIGLLALAIAAVVLMRSVRFGGTATRPGTPGKKWGRIAAEYVSAVVIVAVAVLLKMRLTDSFGPLPTFITLYPAVLLAATIGGGGPGIVATMLAALAADYWFIPPLGQFSIDAPNDVLALGIFTGTGLFFSILAERLHRARWAEAVTVTQEQQLEESARLNEELSQQSEELSQQSEELAQQNEELQTQSEEIQTLNTDLQHREDILQTLLDAARLGAAEQAVMQDICAAAKDMFGPAASAVLVLEPQDGRLMVRAQAGLGPEGAKIELLPAANCFAELVIAENKTAALADASLRPDLSLVKIPGEQPFQAILVAPMRTDGRPFGVVGIYSHQKQEWTSQQFRMAEWLAAQCTHILETLRLQEELRRLYAEQQTIFNSVPAMIWYKDTKNNFVRVNRAVALAVGKPLEAIEGKSAYDVFPDEAERYYQDDLQVINSGQPKLGILEQMGIAGGEKRWVQTDKIPYRNERGDITGVLVLSVDVTDRKQAEEALARLAAIVESSDDAILSKDIHGAIQTWNAGAERLFGYRAEEVVGQPITLLLPPERIQEEGQILQRLLSGQRVEHLETVRVAKDGRRIEVSVTSSPLKDQDGQIVGASKIVHDIADRKRAEKALHESETLLCAVTEGSPDPIFLKDRNSRILLANAATCAAMGKPAEQIIGKTDAEVYADPAVGRAIMENDVRVMEAGQTLIVEEVVPGPDCPRTYLSTKTPYRDEDGRVIGIVGVARDITDHKAAEEALRKSEQEFRSLAEAVPNIVWATRPDGWNIYFNQQWMDYTGLTLDESYGHGWNTPFHPDDKQRAWDAWQRATQHDEPYLLECRLRRADGVYRWWLIHGTPIRDANGEIQKWFGTCTDIHEFKQAEERLRDSEQQFRALADSIPNLAWWANGDGYITWYNRRWYEYTGTTPEQMEGWGWQVVHDPVELPRVLERWKAALAEGKPWEDTFPLRRHDGIFRPHLSRAVPICDEQGRVVRWFGTNTDITERIEVEESLQRAKEAADAANVAKSQFLANMSHELRTPMNAILGMIDVALPKATDPTVLDCLRTAKGSGDLLLTLLNDLLDSAKIESGKLELESAPFSLRRMLDQITRVLSVRASENGLSFRCRVPEETPDAVVGDRMRLQQVLLNLAGNAIKFTERGEVEISLRALSEDGEACLEFAVRDTGIGISSTGQERLFQPFTQSDASMARRFGGTGLGLSICRSLVEMMGGCIWVESELGKGSTFYFTAHLPLAKEIPADFEVPVAIPTAACAQLRILLVEDNPANQKLATYILEDRGHLVEIAGNGQEAVTLTEQNSYDVILMDVQMPDMNGLEATAAIRKREAEKGTGPICRNGPEGASHQLDLSPFPRIPIIAMTAHAMKGDRDRCLAAGMDGYLSKPIDGLEMIALVESLAAGLSPVATSGAASAPTRPQAAEPPTTPVFDPELALKRRKAEQLLHAGKARPALTVSEADAHALVHELQVYQIELEMQNEELQRAHAAAEEASQRYSNEWHCRLLRKDLRRKAGEQFATHFGARLGQ